VEKSLPLENKPQNPPSQVISNWVGQRICIALAHTIFLLVADSVQSGSSVFQSIEINSVDSCSMYVFFLKQSKKQK